jgi:hypothetical protein
VEGAAVRVAQRFERVLRELYPVIAEQLTEHRARFRVVIHTENRGAFQLFRRHGALLTLIFETNHSKYGPIPGGGQVARSGPACRASGIQRTLIAITGRAALGRRGRRL